MGDRVLFQVHGKSDFGRKTEFSPVIYGHWSGYYSEEICRKLAERMRGREGDVQYTAARLCGILHERVEGNLSVGLWNADELLTASDSQGDAGVVLIEASNAGLKFQCLGGYLMVGKEGFPEVPAQMREQA